MDHGHTLALLFNRIAKLEEEKETLTAQLTTLQDADVYNVCVITCVLLVCE